MKITKQGRDGMRREALLKEYFLTASLIALFRRAAEEVAGMTRPAEDAGKVGELRVPVRIRR